MKNKQLDRPTPETDAETMRDEYNHAPFAPSDTVPADFARRLERERDEWYYKAHANAAFVLEARAERDEARMALEEETRFHNRTHKQLSKTKCKLMDAMQAIIDTLEENRYLADGDDCTLAKLKAVVPDWK